jgi:flagellar biosynthesis protein FliQ
MTDYLIASIGTLLCLVFIFLGGIHFYWGIGGKWGLSVALPQTNEGEKPLNPGLIACFIVGLGLLIFATLALLAANIITLQFLPIRVTQISTWLVAVIFALRAIGDFKYVGIFRRVHETEFAKMDKKFFTPLCVAISTLQFILALMFNAH